MTRGWQWYENLTPEQKEELTDRVLLASLEARSTMEAAPRRARKMPVVGKRDQTNVQKLGEKMASKLIGQQEAIDKIVPCVKMFQAGLAPEGRPAGVFLLLGPTGSGKTRTVEVLAEALHGKDSNVLRVDCGEFGSEHEVAKLLGSPPGYLGHRETKPILNQASLSAITSENCALSVVLFDEIEKAAPSLLRLLLGILDKATLRLGDNTSVNFEHTIIFLTSNLGADAMMKAVQRAYGLAGATTIEGSFGNLKAIGERSVRRHFSPEFVNRIDHIIVYASLTLQNMSMILDLELEKIQTHVFNRLTDRCFHVEVLPAAHAWMLDRGFSREYGARNLKRLLQREIMQPMSEIFLTDGLAPGAVLQVGTSGDALSLKPMAAGQRQ